MSTKLCENRMNSIFLQELVTLPLNFGATKQTGLRNDFGLEVETPQNDNNIW